MPRVLHALSIIILALTASAAASADKPVIAVLYFDNDTGDKEYDVLQKGFADMMITDLSGTGAVTVVERDKLQEVLGELKLQRSRYFNKRTAVKLGRGLGARYALTGSFVAIKPKIRINARLIDVRTGKVVLGTSAIGRSSQIFDLEQKLVRDFLAGLQLKFSPTGRAKTKVKELSTVLAYSKAVDLADEGDYEKASKQMKQVVSSAPTFVLARVKRAELIKRYKESKARRIAGDEQALKDLFALSERFLDNNSLVKLDRDGANHYIGFRVTRGQILLTHLQRSLAPKDPGKDRWGRKRRAPRPLYYGSSRKDRARSLGLARAYVDNQIALLREIKAYQTKFSRSYNGKVNLARAYAKLPDRAKRLQTRAKLDRGGSQSIISTIDSLFRFTFMGWADPDRSDQTTSSYNVAPPVGYLDKKRGRKVMAIMESGYQRAHRQAKKSGRSYEAVRLLDRWADYFFFIGDREKGVVKLQQLVDRYPEQAKRYEKRIEIELGMKEDHRSRDRARFAKGLKTCDDMDIATGLRAAMPAAERLKGFAGVEEVVRQVEKACKRHKNGKRPLKRVYRNAALKAGSHGLCKKFNEYMNLAVQYGQSASDAAGYRKNWSICN